MFRRHALLALCLCLVPVCARSADVTVLVKPGVRSNDTNLFPSIQNAVDHAPEPTRGGRLFIQITPGVYHERVRIPQNRPRLTLIGLGKAPQETVISSGHFRKESGGTFFTETVEVNGEGFEADNLTFENTAGRVGQALAISVHSDKTIFKHCRFVGYQDTLFANWGRQYYVDSYISGAVDYIFGNATAVFDHDEIHSVAPGYITAQSRLRADSTTGFVIRDSTVTTEALDATGNRKVSLGRPWRLYSRVVFMNTEWMPVLLPGVSASGARAMAPPKCSTPSSTRRVQEATQAHVCHSSSSSRRPRRGSSNRATSFVGRTTGILQLKLPSSRNSTLGSGTIPSFGIARVHEV